MNMNMTTEINIRNGGGWNNYTALRELATLPVGTRGLLTQNGVWRLDISPADSERPYGIAARYFAADGEEMFCQRFDQNDSAQWIRARVTALLLEGISHRIAARATQLSRAAYVQKITAWRRNFDALPTKRRNSGDKLRATIGQWRAETGKFSRKECWNFTHAILAGARTFAEVKALF